jgi:hypothetical protein
MYVTDFTHPAKNFIFESDHDLTQKFTNLTERIERGMVPLGHLLRGQPVAEMGERVRGGGVGGGRKYWHA